MSLPAAAKLGCNLGNGRDHSDKGQPLAKIDKMVSAPHAQGLHGHKSVEWRHACLSGNIRGEGGKSVVLQPMHHTRQMIGMHIPHIGRICDCRDKRADADCCNACGKKTAGNIRMRRKMFAAADDADKNRGISQPDCNYKRLANRVENACDVACQPDKKAPDKGTIYNGREQGASFSGRFGRKYPYCADKAKIRQNG